MAKTASRPIRPLDMSMEFELLSENIAWIFRNHSDLPAAMEKVIMPRILSVSRLKGSAYGARDSTMGKGRKKVQNDLTNTLAKTRREKWIVMHNALNRNMPTQILTPVREGGIPVERDFTNLEKQITARKQADVIRRVEGEKTKGYQVRMKTFGESNTLWSDLQKANLGEPGGAKVPEKAEKKP